MVGVGLYCEQFFLRSIFWAENKTICPPFLSKADPFNLESHICFESLNMQGFPEKKDAFLNPCLKTAPKHFFKRVPHE